MPAEVETMFSAREVPWHKLGVVTPDVLTAEEAIVTAGLDWEVEKQPVFVRVEKALPYGPPVVSFEAVKDQSAVVRTTDKSVLGIVGSRYHIINNKELFSFADNLVDDGSAKYETAGALMGGRVVWVQMRVRGDLRVAGEEYQGYIILSSSHDGSKALRAAVTPVRVVCWNTLNMSERNSVSSWTVRHTRSAMGRVAEARHALNLTWDYLNEFQLEAEQLAYVPVNEADVEKFLDELFPTTEESTAAKTTRATNKRAEVWGVWNSKTIAPIKATGWGFVNAVNEWELWKSSVRGGEEKRHERQAKQILDQRMPVTRKARELVRVRAEKRKVYSTVS